MLKLKEVMNVWQNVTFLFNKFAIWAYLLIIIDFRQIILMDFIRYCYDYKIKLVIHCNKTIYYNNNYRNGSFLLVLSFSYGLCRTELLTLDYDYIILILIPDI
jgi:hypothetical protein